MGSTILKLKRKTVKMLKMFYFLMLIACTAANPTTSINTADSNLEMFRDARGLLELFGPSVESAMAQVRALVPSSFTWNKENVYNSLFSNDAIVTTVSSGLFSLMVSTIGWFLISQVLSFVNAAPVSRSGQVDLDEVAANVTEAIENVDNKFR